MDTELIDRIYESAFIPEAWPAVLESLAGLADARGGVLLVERDLNVRGTSSAAMTEIVDTFLSGNFFARTERARRAYAAQIQGFTREQDFFVEEELEEDPLYRELLRPAGLGWCAATVIAVPTGDTIIFSAERDYAKGPVSDAVIAQLDPLRPHLARASLCAARLQLELARAATHALDLLGMAALVFDGSDKVIAANGSLEACEGLLRWRAREKFALRDRKADAQLQVAINALAANHVSGVRSFAVQRSDDLPPMIAHIVPIMGSARDIFARCSGIVIFSPVTMAQAPTVELVQSLFDLSPAEARVARRLTAGDSVEAIASQNRVSVATVRTQVRGVLEKTGCQRQAEVVSLLSGTIAPLRA